MKTKKVVPRNSPRAEIKSLIQNLSEEDIINYIGTENLELFKNKLAILPFIFVL